VGVFVPITAGAQVEIVFVIGGEIVENRLWFTFDTPPINQAALDGLAGGVAAWHVSNVLPLLSVDIQLAAVEAKEWENDPPALISVVAPLVNGGNASPSHSANVAIVVPFRWPLNRPKLRRNKNYVSGVPTSEVDLNTPSFALRDGLFEAYAALIDAARLFEPHQTWRWVVASAFSGGSARSAQLVAECIGPPPNRAYKLGQRRKRLAASS